eukprot:11567486-Alexandrium_andersonii.AAC.1
MLSAGLPPPAWGAKARKPRLCKVMDATPEHPLKAGHSGCSRRLRLGLQSKSPRRFTPKPRDARNVTSRNDQHLAFCMRNSS